MKYSFYTLDVNALLEEGKTDKRTGFSFALDLNSNSVRSRVIKSEDLHPDSALFYQINEILRGGRGYGRITLKEALLYLDFSEVFDRKADRSTTDKEQKKRLREDARARGNALIENGFSVLFRGFEDYIHFVPFDRSASMSRAYGITFVAEPVFNEIDERVRLGIDFSRINVVPSKYFAYRGLLMSDGRRINPDKVCLNEKTVLVLPADKHLIGEQQIVTVEADSKLVRENQLPLNILRESKVLQVEAFDGEGLVSPGYAEKINTELKYRSDEGATSFQVRMPFTKGMLHTVDFQAFIAEYRAAIAGELPDKDGSELYVRDAFGILRDLDSVEIILTEGMFKCAGWLRAYAGQLREAGDEAGSDPVKLYFDRFRKYNHALYIGNTDRNITDTGMVKMNYQFLNTMALTKEELESLLTRHYDGAHALKNDPEAGRARILGLSEYSDDPETDLYDGDTTQDQPSWIYALKNNVAFMRDPKIRDMIAGTTKALIRDSATGRIDVPGCMRYLSDDLLRLLVQVMERIDGVVKEDSSGKSIRPAFIKELVRQSIYMDKFYMPGHEAFRLYSRRHYALLRSPHLSRNEECALVPYTPPKNSLYERYFGHLKGVLMVDYNSSAPMILGGADYDGDYVKLILDEDINKAVLRGAYELKDGAYVRKYPIAQIPGISSSDEIRPAAGKVTYAMLERTFSNRVGAISNLAIRIGRKEYSGRLDEKDITALCTIATGLEIDAVKTGVRPKTDSLNKYADSDDAFLNIKYSLDDIEGTIRDAEAGRKGSRKKRRTQGGIFVGEHTIYSRYDEESGTYTAYIKKRAGGTASSVDLFRAEDPVSDSGIALIDRLPGFYLRELCSGNKGPERKSPAGGEKDAQSVGFVFETDRDWKQKALQDGRTGQMKDIIGAYRKLNADIALMTMMRSHYGDKHNAGRIIHNLEIEYDTTVDTCPIAGLSVDEAVDKMYEELFDCIESNEQADEALARAYDNETAWEESVRPEEKRALLVNILGRDSFSVSTNRILFDTYGRNPQNLISALKDVKNIKFMELDEQELKDAAGSKWARGYDEALYDEMFSHYRLGAAREVWQSEARDICREKVLRLFEGDVRQAVACAYAMTAEMDEKHTFFWDVFTASDIADLIWRE